MSMKAFVAVKEYSKATSTRYITLLMIAEMVNDDYLCAWCNVATISRYARISKATVIRAVGDLRDAGELITENENGTRCNYYVPILPGEPGYNPQKCSIRGAEHKCNGFHTPLDISRATVPPRKLINTGKTNKKPPKTGVNLQPVSDCNHYQSDTGVNLIPTGVNLQPDQSQSDTGTGVNLQPDLLVNSYVSLSRYRNAHTRASTSNLAEKIDEDREPDPETPPRVAAVPPHDEPETTEQRAMWRSVQKRIAAKMPATPLHDFPRCHLYQEAPALFELKLAAGMDVGMFRSRYESLIVDALRDETQRSLVVLEIWR